MAMFINCSRDWTYDLYTEDVKKYGADVDTNTAGVDYNAYFMGYMKRTVERFMSRWNEKHNGKMYAPGYGWAGDEFADSISEWFSDFYKEAYGQRPHLPMWFYVHPLGLPMSEDTARGFCANPVADAEDEARFARTNMPA